MKNIRIWEPHSDDAWLSLSKLITTCYDDGDMIEIITCSISDGLPSISSNFPWESYFLREEFPKMHIGCLAMPDYSWSLRAEKIEAEALDDFYVDSYGKHDFKCLCNRILRIAESSNALDLVPLGIQHPFHHIVHSALKSTLKKTKNSSTLGISYYEDVPYSLKKKNKSILELKTKELRLVRNYNPDIEFKLDVMKTVYSTQLFFFKQSIMNCKKETVWA